jgi:hypothetical protein
MEDSIRKSRRFGRFSIDGVLMEDSDPEKMLFLMGHFVIVRCEHNFMYDRFEYQAWSMLFDPVPEAVQMPEYRIIFHENKDNDGNVVLDGISAEKV